MKITLVKIKRNHNYDTGIDKYEKKIFESLSKKSLQINVREIIRPSKFKVFLSLLGFSLWGEKIDSDILHLTFPTPLGFYRGKAKLVVTVHDLCPLITPKAYPFYVPLIFKINIKQLIKSGASFIVNSKQTKFDLQKYFKVDPSNINVTYLGVDDNFGSTEITRNNVLDKYNIPQSYFLFTGAMNKRKNLDRVIEAFFKFITKVKHNNVKLVLAGRMNWGGSQVEATVKKLGIKDKVLLPGYIEDKDLPVVISCALSCIYVSLYEGFGFPALEAMKCGTPVLASNCGSISEVTRDAAYLVNPLDIDEISEGLIELYNNSKLRQSLIKRGIERSKFFSWERTSSETIKAYNYFLGNVK